LYSGIIWEDQKIDIYTFLILKAVWWASCCWKTYLFLSFRRNIMSWIHWKIIFSIIINILSLLVRIIYRHVDNEYVCKMSIYWYAFICYNVMYCCLKEHTYFTCTFKCKLLLFILIPLTNDKSRTYVPICTYIII